MTAADAASSMRLAVVGDLHDYSLGIWPWELLGKPLAGQTNLWLNRRKRFDRGLIAPTIARAAVERADLALFSGDLTTTSRPREFRSIAAALAPLLESCESVIVAGNHDRYTQMSSRSRRIERAFAGRAPEVFPYSRPLVGGWRLIAVDAAIPRLLDSRGCIGNRQLQHVRSLLTSLRKDQGAVVLCHYPFGKPSVLPPMKPGHRLLDESAWRDTIAACRGRVLIVHGHVHCPWIWRPHDLPRVVDLNAGSPTLVSRGWPRGQGFWTLRLDADPAVGVTLEHHVMGGGEAPVGLDADDVEAQSDDGHPGWTTRRIQMRW